MQRPLPIDERLIAEGIRDLKKALAHPTGDTGWVDELPELPELPKAPEDTVAIIIPRKR